MKKVTPDWDDLWGTISHMGSSQSGMNIIFFKKIFFGTYKSQEPIPVWGEPNFTFFA